ncbi:EcsC family protein [Brevibacillus ginsengisoli]|uniref:EcsC family protein n=1 Tax=Brevibacillus ginsengisoli TaxID=363854 RepID=UPI003CF271D5
MEIKEQLLRELAQVDKWEREQKDLWFWEKLGRLPFVLLDKVTPAFLQDKFSQLLNETVSYVETGGRYLISEDSVYKRFIQHVPQGVVPDSHAVAQLPLHTMDQVASDLRENYIKLATLQGATTGFGGIFTLAIDIPFLLGMSLKTLQEIALCYGYNPRSKEERIFVVKCLQFTSSDIVGKRAILEELTQFQQEVAGKNVISQIQGWREVVVTYGDHLGWKKLFQLIPIAGMLFGAYLNRKSIEDIAEAGMMLYRKRRILEKLGKLER